MAAKIALLGKIVSRDLARYTDYDIEFAQFGQGQWPAFRALNIDFEELMDNAAESGSGWSLSIARGFAGTSATIGVSVSKSS